MSLFSLRLSKLEVEAEHHRATELAKELNIEVSEAVLLARAERLHIPMPDGQVDIEPALRCLAVEWGYDPDEAADECKRLLAEVQPSRSKGA
ncbi:MAG: hypothetical protein HY675_17880 [Chloroflexi bacterium]|nr:hypothetical protein [Chloroflexota bacterium]